MSLPAGLIRWLWRCLVNRIRRFFINRLIEHSQRKYAPTSSRTVLQLSSDTMLKMGPRALLEARALRFVAERTSLPVPEVLDSWACGDRGGYLITRKLRGITLDDALPQLSQPQKHALARQLGDCVSALRSIPHSCPPAICAVGGGPFREDRIDGFNIGPFANEREYHDWRVSLARSNPAASPATLARMDAFRARLRDDHRIVFTHGDLSPNNLLVEIRGPGESDVHLTGVLDWEMAGWRPEYWEYVKCLHCSDHLHDWVSFVHHGVVSTFEEEKEIDDQIQDYLGEPY